MAIKGVPVDPTGDYGQLSYLESEPEVEPKEYELRVRGVVEGTAFVLAYSEDEAVSTFNERPYWYIDASSELIDWDVLSTKEARY